MSCSWSTEVHWWVYQEGRRIRRGGGGAWRGWMSGGKGGNGRWRRVRNVAFKFGKLEAEVKTRVKDRLRNLLSSVLRLKVTSYVSNPPFNTENLVKPSTTLCRGRPLPSRIGYRVFIIAALPSKLDREENGSTTQGFAKQ